jgi:hypothetical protein
VSKGPPKVHFVRKGEKHPVCGVVQNRLATFIPSLTTCSSCIYKMRKAGVRGTPDLEVSKPGRKQGTKVRRLVHKLDCDMGEDCSCSASFNPGRG